MISESYQCTEGISRMFGTFNAHEIRALSTSLGLVRVPYSP